MVFKRGDVPHNKGKKGWINSGSFKNNHKFIKGGKIGWFKKGNKINLGKKRKDMLGNRLNPNAVNNLKPHWKNTETKRKSVIAKEIGSDEQRLIGFIKKNNIPFRFIGNSGFSVGNYFPDFISKDNSTLMELISGTNKKIEKREKAYEHAGYRFVSIRTNLIRRGHFDEIRRKLYER